MKSTIQSIKSSYTCLTCGVIFEDSAKQRQHYSTEWHRYNLHRKVDNLSSITLEEFQKKKEVLQNTEASQTKQNWHCKICQKKFHSEKQHKNHLVSNKHKKKEEETEMDVDDTKDNKSIKEETQDSKDEDSLTHSYLGGSYCQVNMSSTKSEEMQTDSDVESLDSDEWLDDLENPIDQNNCLFCNHHSSSMKRNLKHMMIEHSFFLPDLEYCIDKRALLLYLGEKISGKFRCIWCTGKEMRSVEAVRMHMIDKGHCKLPFEGEGFLEYSHFYDYSSSYPDAEDADPDEELSESSEVPLNDDSFMNYELKLPSGKVVGHRALMRYYQQSPVSTGSVVVAKNRNEKLRKLTQQYRALGGPAMQEEATRRRVRDIRYLNRIQGKYLTQLQCKQNKLQKNFRSQINF